MSALTIPFIVRTTNPVVCWVLLAFVGAAIVAVAYLLARHHHRDTQAEKLGQNRRHDGRHGNH